MEDELKKHRALINKWTRRASRNIHIHYECENHFSKANYYLGIPTMIITTIVGASVFTSLENEAIGEVKLLIGFFSLLSIILVSLQTFLNYSSRAERHRITSRKYGSVRRQLEHLCAFHINDPDKLRDELEIIKKELDIISESAPVAPTKIRNKINMNFEEHNEGSDVNEFNDVESQNIARNGIEFNYQERNDIKLDDVEPNDDDRDDVEHNDGDPVYVK